MNRLIRIAFIGLSLVLSACSGGAGSTVSSLRGPVIIDASPQDQTVIEGQTAVFRVAAESAATLSYQWQRDGSDIPGATASTYETPPVNLADDGAQFTVRVSTASAMVESNSATLYAYSDLSIPAPTTYLVNPAATDTAIDPSFGDHYAYINTAVSPKGKLFVFFPGTSAKPRAYLLIIQAAADNGYHALGLAYPNSQTVTGLCSGSNDLECPGDIHGEVLTGQDASTLIDVSSADSIENRLLRLLSYLAQQNPDDGWDQFLGSADTIRWDSIRVAGHSQGGAVAGYIGKRYAVDRVIFFSSPYDLVNHQTAAWVSAAGPTDPGRYFGFSHLRDGVIPWQVIEQNWPGLHMNDFGDYVDADSTTPPFGGSHMLSTDLDKPSVLIPDALAYHNITVVDANTPLDDHGLPGYRRVWQSLCFL